MKYILSMLLIVMGVGLFAQEQMLSAKDNDPKAKKILDKIKKAYDGYTAMEVDFDLTVELPEQEKQVQQGMLIQQGDRFVLDLEQQAIYNNGTSICVYLKEQNEVQINDADLDESSEMLSPKDVLKMYTSGEYVYKIAEYAKLGKTKMTVIDFKPLDRDSEYFKVKLWVKSNTDKMCQMKLFSRDGSRYTLKINNIVPNKTYASSRFEFNKSKYPNVYIEDLRID